MYTRIIRSFLPVGQGSFYRERFVGCKGKTFNIVYDCGSSTGVRFVKQAIMRFFNPNEEIEALFISHLDEDHVNGIPVLLIYCKVKKIYFPLISSEDKKLMKIDFELKKIKNRFIYDFLKDPNKAISSLHLDHEHEPKLIPVLEHEDTQTQKNSSQSDHEIELSGKNVFKDDEGNNYGKSLIGLDWLLIPYNFRQKERIEKLGDNLKKVFESNVNGDIDKIWKDKKNGIIDADEIDKIWRSEKKEHKEKIKEAYKKIPGGLNVNSMTLFSGTTEKTLSQRPMKCCNYCQIYAYGQRHMPSGCLYTGDYDASGKEKWDDLKKAYENVGCWGNIGCVQIPHHGSKHNFNDNFLTMDSFYVISAGLKNRYRHPHSDVINKFLYKHIKSFIVTESMCTGMCFLIE